MNNEHVVILLSTYNGQRYLSQQLDSLCRQTFSHFSILIRDDGSSDASVEVVKGYVARYENIKLIAGENLGVVRSFLELLKAAPSSPQHYYAFCDQDDVWQPEKLEVAVARLRAESNPDVALYFSRLKIVDPQLQSLGISAIPAYIGFENALVENAALGCTQVFGASIRQLMLQAQPELMMMHDWWAYLLAATFGTVIYDAEPRIAYRQHTANVVGWDKNMVSLLKKSKIFLHNLLIQKNGLQSLRQAQYFLHAYPDMPTDKRNTLTQLLALRESGGMFDRYQFLMQHTVKRNHKLENMILALTVIAGLH